MKLETIHLKVFDKRLVKIACLQLKSPFFNEINIVRNESKEKIFGVTNSCEDNYKSRTIEVLSLIRTITKDHDVDFIVLPEYTFLKDDNIINGQDDDSLSVCRKLSNDTKSIIIGNYYDQHNRFSTSFVVLPVAYAESEIYFTNKITASDNDKSVLKSGYLYSDDEKKQLRFLWKEKSSNKQAFFQVFTCKDFLFFTSIHPLREWPHLINLDLPGIIFCPMSTDVITPFEDRAVSLIRDIDKENGERCIITVLCNATTMVDLENNQVCGYSQVISPIDTRKQLKPMLKKGVEGVVFAEVNPFINISKPTPINQIEANAVLIDSTNFESVKSNGKVTLVEIAKKKKHFGLIFNPNFLNSLAIRKIYGFMRLDNYSSVKINVKKRFEKLSNLSIPIHGIYGVHDIILFSYEEYYNKDCGRELLKTRIWPMVKDNKYFDKEHFGCCFVDNVLKYRGTIIDNNINFDKIIFNQIDVNRIKEIFRKIINGIKIDDADRSTLIDRKILLESEYDVSDISDQELNEKKLEFLVILILFRTDEGPQAQDVHHYFIENIFPVLAHDKRIRTIERISSDGTGFVDGHYIIHIVGDLTDLNNIVIGNVHKLFSKHRVGTRVIIPAERISHNEYPCLFEEPKSVVTEPLLNQIILACRSIEVNEDTKINSIIPSMVNLLDNDSRDMLLKIYYYAYELSSSIKSPNWSSNLFKFIYGLTAGIKGDVHGLDFNELIVDYCQPFILDIGRSIEIELKDILANIREKNMIEPDVFQNTLNELAKVISGEKGKLNIDKIEIGTAAFIFNCLIGYCSPGKKFCDEAENHFSSIFGEEELTNHLNCINVICSELFNVRLAVLDHHNIDYFKENDMEKVGEIMNSLGIKISSGAKVNKDKKEDKLIFKDRGEIFIIEDKKDKIHLHYQIITKEMIGLIRNFAENARNKMSHSDPILYPQLILNGTHSGLKFLVNIGRRVNQNLYDGPSIFISGQ